MNIEWVSSVFPTRDSAGSGSSARRDMPVGRWETEWSEHRPVVPVARHGTARSEVDDAIIQGRGVVVSLLIDEFDLDIRIEPSQTQPLEDCDDPDPSQPGSTCDFSCFETCGGTCECH
ncbi:hypothetical protein AB0L74_21950 [Streptomyces sp. NPDC052020]|uniref:hypothetical protein n=1 Tax=Streptomyces sp. NPDC052020 TaxID=3155677 RepID=UPI0034458F24